MANSYGNRNVRAGDEVVVTMLEHHSNIVPWQLLCERVGATLRVVPVNDAGELDLEAYATLLNERTRIVAVAHVSNAIGTVNPVAKMIAMAHAAGAVVLIDGAQAAPHLPIDVQSLDADFYALSGHKAYGPTGIGLLYGKAKLLDAMPPWQGGGDMIASVSFAKTTYAKAPARFEAGTPNIAGTIGLAEAFTYVQRVGLDNIAAHENALLDEATARVAAIPGVRVIGTAAHKAAVLSFVLEGVHPHDIGTILDRQGVAVRTGQHCAEPLMVRMGVPATVRAVFALYNTRADIDALVRGIERVKEIFA